MQHARLFFAVILNVPPTQMLRAKLWLYMKVDIKMCLFALILNYPL